MEDSFGKVVKYEDGGTNHPFTVYMILNKINGKSYIGATQKGTRARGWIHKTTARSGRNEAQVIYRAMRKYGEENFKFFTLKECADWWDALESERAYIALFKPRYNMTDGGGGIKGHKMSAESRAKMSAAKKGKPGTWARMEMPQHVKERLAAARRSEKGRPVSDKCMAALAINHKLANAVRRRAIICLVDGTEYPSLTAAGKVYSLTTGQLTRLCKLGCSTRSGLRFAYKDKK